MRPGRSAPSTSRTRPDTPPPSAVPPWRRLPDVTYLVVGRDPRDVAISYEHHAANMDFAHFLELRALAMGNDDLVELPPRVPLPDDPVERFRLFVHDDTVAGPPNLAAVLHHLDTGWQRRADPNVALFHYADLKADLTGELLRLAGVLSLPCTPDRARALVPEASLARMRDRATELAPVVSQGNWKDPRAFFRSGGSGEWRARLTDGDLAAHEARVAALATSDLATWAHGGWHRLRAGHARTLTRRSTIMRRLLTLPVLALCLVAPASAAVLYSAPASSAFSGDFMTCFVRNASATPRTTTISALDYAGNVVQGPYALTLQPGEMQFMIVNDGAPAASCRVEAPGSAKNYRAAVHYYDPIANIYRMTLPVE